MPKLDKKSVIRKACRYARQRLVDDCSGHDWWHAWRVWNNALCIAKGEKKVDRFVIELAAILHDVADWKFYDGDMQAGPRRIKRFLISAGADKTVANHVCDIIGNMSFKGAGVRPAPLSREGMIVQDADRLDAIGAIGIARTFAYGGVKGRAVHDPEKKPANFQNFAQYKNNHSSSINHFYERMLLVKDMLNTDKAKLMAESRHGFLEEYLEHFLREWEGEDYPC
jgi:uncharacterized protein